MPLRSDRSRFAEKLKGVKVEYDAPVGKLRLSVARALNLSVHRIELRQWFEKDAREQMRKNKQKIPSYNDDTRALSSYGVTSDATDIEVKDLGPQFSYRGVFLIEYLGPILIIAAFAFFSGIPVIGRGSAGPVALTSNLTLKGYESPEGSPEWNRFVQALAIALWIAHFAKRELETLFVHKFSRPTMPLFNLFKNSTYYWGFALAVGYPLCHPNYVAPGKTQVIAGLGLWCAAQLTNLAVHLQLAGMRKEEGDKDRKPPSGFLFSLVSCPNYTAEVLGWVAWTILTQVGMAGLFTLAGLYQMTVWALAKHRDYCKVDPAIKKQRTSIIPFVI